MHTWKTRIAATLAVLMLTNCISPAAFAQNTEESPQSTQVSLLSGENNAGFTIENGVLTAYTGSATNVAIPEGVTVIGDGSSSVFGSRVESVTIPASVTEIANNAFYTCTGLTSVTFDEGSRLKTIGNDAFYAVNHLESLIIPEGVTSIGKYAFAAMNKLQTITLPGTLTTVCGGEWFGNLFAREPSGGAPAALASVNITEDGEQYRSHDGAVYSADGKTIIYCPAAKQSIDWLNGVTAIGAYAFGNSTMPSVNIPGTVTEISANAFNRAKMTSLEIPGSVKTIGASAFFFSQLTNVTLNEGLERIENSAFSQSRVAQVTIPASVTYIGKMPLILNTAATIRSACWVRTRNWQMSSSRIITLSRSMVWRIPPRNNMWRQRKLKKVTAAS